jgi:choline/glycine/proline betaine transport protein
VQRVFWALAEGTVAATPLSFGGLQALRQASLTTGLPLAVFLLVAAYGLVRALRVDHATQGVPTAQQLQGGVESQPGQAPSGSDPLHRPPPADGR